MDSIFSDRITDVPRSFIREILKDALDPGVISFAGGLPNRDLFPADALKAAANRVFDTYGRDIFQYSSSEGFLELRGLIAEHYRRRGLAVAVENILITSGSQQGLDLLGKTLLNDGDGLVIEEPGYLGAIQAFSIYKARFIPVPVTERGMDTDRLGSVLRADRPKLMYTVPNFQNPSGITYPDANRRDIADILNGTATLLIEDDPYGDLRFCGRACTSFKTLAPDNTVLLGSFSKVVVPGFRLGWIVAPDPLMQKLIIAKQASDLHTNHFIQCVIYQYLRDNDINAHISRIVDAYGGQKQAMITAIERHFPAEVTCTNPDGGMFLWASLPPSASALDLFKLALADQVVFVPGDPFYIDRTGVNTLRLNYSCVDRDTIAEGINRLGSAIGRLLQNHPDST
ncbi:PLP-dependent aminotransferase family protein [Exilibacterium tricleocarpae]|uniref:PLP-dependent aminotransferase family protein n=1 Tax=Exilibacterium tricleocarpae TaxID=2591008 RepID=A0A545TZF1_9GAMM|nr:PLP-dependent aminotransferase family protein [Exilibacterium tricleocarpae]TQV82594.1 PLP-dependent aminotransferase family protein [Exilibacterium tricleocarpae]